MDKLVRVRMRTQYAGARGTCSPGGTIDLGADEAKALVAGGYAVLVGELFPAVETAARRPAARAGAKAAPAETRDRAGAKAAPEETRPDPAAADLGQGIARPSGAG